MHSSLLFFVSIAAVATAVPFTAPQSHVTLPLARMFNLTGSATLAAADRSRAKTLAARTQPVARKADGTPVSVSVTNFAVSYIASVSTSRPAHTSAVHLMCLDLLHRSV